MLTQRPLRTPISCSLAFTTSFCVMTVETVASRLIAPRIGVSHYTWTAVIGVIMAGLSIGNLVGGRLADRRSPAAVLGWAYVIASLTCLLVLWLNNDLHELIQPGVFPLWAWILLYVGAVFTWPSIALGCIVPVLATASVRSVEGAGRAVGRIYASSSAGSIAGTFASGFWLIGTLGTKNTTLLVAGILAALGLWFLVQAPRWVALARATACVILLAGATLYLQKNEYLCSECMLETNYFCINVTETEKNGRTVRELMLDRLVHSYNDLHDPTHLVYGYEETYVGLVQPLLANKPDLSALFIGGGGYTFPRYMEATAPDTHLVVTEIDPGVTEAAYLWLGLGRDTRIETHNVDSRRYLMRSAAPDTYDLVFGDAFNDFSVPYHLTTVEFAQSVDRTLSDGGLYIVNIIDGGGHGQFLRAFYHTLSQVFSHVIVIPSQKGWRESIRTTFVLAASQQPIDTSSLPEDYRPFSDDVMQGYMAQGEALVLSDDYVPVDNLLSPVMEDSFADFNLDASIVGLIGSRARVVGILVLATGIAGSVWLIRQRRQRRLAAPAAGCADHAATCGSESEG